MLRELTKLSDDMVSLRGHIAKVAALRRPALAATPLTATSPRHGPRPRILSRPGRDWRTPLELVVAAALSGSSFLFLRIAAPMFGPAPVIDLRLAIGALLLTPFLWRSRLQLAAAGWWKIVSIGALNILAPLLLFAWNSERAPAGVNAIVFSLSVPFTTLTAFLFFGERMGGRRVVGMLSGLVGVVVLAGGNLLGAGTGAAVAAGTLATLLYGAGANLVRQQFGDIPPTALVAALLASNALLLVPLAIWTWPSTPISIGAWSSVVALGSLGTSVVYVLYFRLIQRIGAPSAATIAYLAPVFGVLWAWLALGEALTTSMAAGGALILGGMWYGQQRSMAPAVHRPAPSPEACMNCNH
jgi:drug/metabolite transporter (DMT)-like permease